MADSKLTPEAMGQLAAALSLPVETGQLEQVAHSFQELLRSLEPLQALGLREVEPAMVFHLPQPRHRIV